MYPFGGTPEAMDPFFGKSNNIDLIGVVRRLSIAPCTYLLSRGHLGGNQDLTGKNAEFTFSR